MAQFQHLPIYKQTYEILLRTMTATKDFPREYKYALGQEIKGASPTSRTVQFFPRFQIHHRRLGEPADAGRALFAPFVLMESMALTEPPCPRSAIKTESRPFGNDPFRKGS